MDLKKQVFPEALGFLLAIAQIFPFLFIIHFRLVKTPVLFIAFLEPFQFLQQFFIFRQKRAFFRPVQQWIFFRHFPYVFR